MPVTQPQIVIQDEGTTKGTVNVVNFTGTAVSATVNGNIATVNVTGGGVGTTVYSGNAVLNFGSTPGTNFVTTTITGQTNIVAGSIVKAYIMSSPTATHNAYEHAIVPIKLSCGNIIVGTGFDIYAITDWRLDGTFNVTWEWI